MDSISIANGRISGSFGTARVEIRELAARECVVTHSAQIRVGTSGSLVLRVDGDSIAVRASVVKSSLLAPSLEGMIYRSVLRVDAGDDIRMRRLIPSDASGEASPA
ncbi:MAG: hypothetical protein WC538_10825 [Thermoanaerobaculia bacterium]|jgi:hypothetical protein